MEDIVKEVLAFIEQAGSFIVSNGFRLAMKQVFYYGISDMVWALLCTIGASILVAFGSKHVKKEGVDETSLSLHIIGGILFVLAAVLVTAGLRYFINPEWYAVKFLIEQVK